MADLWAALCLMLVIEGLILFVAPGAWKRAMEQLQSVPERGLRIAGGVLVLAGLLTLQLVRG